MTDQKPIDMILYCPNCGKQHIDAPETFTPVGSCECQGPYECEACACNRQGHEEWLAGKPWTNPPHRTHLCADPTCAMTWRPADVPTNGVASIKTAGKDDRWVVYPGENDDQLPAHHPV